MIPNTLTILFKLEDKLSMELIQFSVESLCHRPITFTVYNKVSVPLPVSKDCLRTQKTWSSQRTWPELEWMWNNLLFYIIIDKETHTLN